MDSKQKRLRISRGMRHGRKQQYVIIMKEDLREKATYELYLAFNGALSDGLEGFYKSSYKARSGNVRYVNVRIVKQCSFQVYVIHFILLSSKLGKMSEMQ